MTRTLVLLRHGRTPWNHEGRIQGQRPVGLDDVGVAQAAAVAPVMAALAPARLVGSDLERTRLTALPVAAACGLESVLDPRLREFGFGRIEGLTHAELAERDPDAYAHLRAGDYHLIPSAEPLDDVRARMTAALRDLCASLEPGQTGLAVSHGAAIRVAVAALLEWPDEVFRTLRGLANCGWAVLTERPGAAGFHLSAYNRVVSDGA